MHTDHSNLWWLTIREYVAHTAEVKLGREVSSEDIDTHWGNAPDDVDGLVFWRAAHFWDAAKKQFDKLPDTLKADRICKKRPDGWEVALPPPHKHADGSMVFNLD